MNGQIIGNCQQDSQNITNVCDMDSVDLVYCRANSSYDVFVFLGSTPASYGTPVPPSAFRRIRIVRSGLTDYSSYGRIIVVPPLNPSFNNCGTLSTQTSLFVPRSTWEGFRVLNGGSVVNGVTVRMHSGSDSVQNTFNGVLSIEKLGDGYDIVPVCAYDGNVDHALAMPIAASGFGPGVDYPDVRWIKL